MTKAEYRSRITELRSCFDHALRDQYGDVLHRSFVIDHNDSCDVYVFLQRDADVAQIGTEAVESVAHGAMKKAGIETYGYDGAIPVVRAHVDSHETVQRTCGGNYYMYMT